MDKWTLALVTVVIIGFIAVSLAWAQLGGR
jgi:hypothetical protein